MFDSIPWQRSARHLRLDRRAARFDAGIPFNTAQRLPATTPAGQSTCFEKRAYQSHFVQPPAFQRTLRSLVGLRPIRAACKRVIGIDFLFRLRAGVRRKFLALGALPPVTERLSLCRVVLACLPLGRSPPAGCLRGGVPGEGVEALHLGTCNIRFRFGALRCSPSRTSAGFLCRNVAHSE